LKTKKIDEYKRNNEPKSKSSKYKNEIGKVCQESDLIINPIILDENQTIENLVDKLILNSINFYENTNNENKEIEMKNKDEIQKLDIKKNKK